MEMTTNRFSISSRTIMIHWNAICSESRTWDVERAMDVLLPLVKWQFVRVHLDDIIIFSKLADVHIDLVRQVLMLLVLNNAA